MQKQSKRALVPKLRFPEFRDAGEWERKLLRELATFTSGGTPSKSIQEYWDGDIPWISASTMHDITIYNSDLRVTRKAIGNGTRLAKKGAILILVRGSMLFKRVPICITERDVAFNQDVKAICTKHGVDKRYLLHYLIASESSIPINATGIGAGKIDTNHLKTLAVGVPTIKEQQKIADCLSSLDDLITAEADQLDALNAHKKGLMQQLFPREGETTPRLRFPEFRDKPGWEEKTGDSLFDQISDRNPAPGLPVLAITQDHGAIPRDMIDYHVSVTEKSIESYKVVQVGDFVISLRSFQGGIEYSQYHGICSPAYVVLRRCTEGSDAYFKHYLKTDRFIRVLTRNLEGLRDGKMISYKQFSELLLPVPPSPEQQKIADCLTSLDDLLTAQAAKIETLKTHKKGLMQQLFPSQEE